MALTIRSIVANLIVAIASLHSLAFAAENLVQNGSFEQAISRDQFGNTFKDWFVWRYEGECEMRTSRIAHHGSSSCLLYGGSEPKIRIMQKMNAVPTGRYKLTAWLRGLDIGEGKWGMTIEFAFDEQYISLKKKGTFGWTQLTYVINVPKKKEITAPAFGLWAPGYLWIDSVAMIQVDDNTPLTTEPILGPEEAEIAAPQPLPGETKTIACAECGYKNLLQSEVCYACGTEVCKENITRGATLKTLTSFEDLNPFIGGESVDQHATDGARALKIKQGFVAWDAQQDWSNYDYLKFDVYSDGPAPLPLTIEIRDRETRDYWTRLNYTTMLPPGKSIVVLPLAHLYVGEKSRPGRNLILGGITRFCLDIGHATSGESVYFDNIRLECDTETAAKTFEGLYAFDFGPRSGPLMPGFKRVDPSTSYNKARGYGLTNARIWRASNALQPDPLYQDYLCIESGGIAVDVPDGHYHVFVNIDNPSEFWGDYQKYRQRSIVAQGKLVANESMSFDSFASRYFQFWDTEDSPDEDTFDKYQRSYFHEKEFDVEVTNGRLTLEFLSKDFGCSVSAVILFPIEKSAEGQKFLEHVVEKRRFFFNNYFRRVLRSPSEAPLKPNRDAINRGYVTFTRDYMEDVYYNDNPVESEIDQTVTGFGFAEEFEPLTVAVCPLTELGKVTVSISDLNGPSMVPAKNIAIGYVSYRLTRVVADGSIYTIAPRLIIPRNSVEVRKGTTRRFWLTIRAPQNVSPGLYRGAITIRSEHGGSQQVPVEYEIYPGTLAEIDLPVGPWGHEIRLPWYEEDRQVEHWNHTMAERSLGKLREYGFTTFTGLPRIKYLGFRDGKPCFDFSDGDEQMALARRIGFAMPVVNYAPLDNLNLYFKDEAAMNAAGFTDYKAFLRVVFSAIQEHAEAQGWLPVYWNLGDEPLGDDLDRAIDNAEAYRAAFPTGPPLFTAATSLSSGKQADPHRRFAEAVHAANLNTHDESSVGLLQKSGGDWAFYNGGNRWTYGVYLYKAAKQFDMKFRLNWHWNSTAGNPFYALDCREDDFAWCNTNADGELISTVAFEREMREGIDDYRYLLTLARLAEAKSDENARSLIRDRLAAFQLGDREHDRLFGPADWREFRLKMAKEIARLRIDR
jgi:hypothetical protein